MARGQEAAAATAAAENPTNGERGDTPSSSVAVRDALNDDRSTMMIDLCANCRHASHSPFPPRLPPSRHDVHHDRATSQPTKRNMDNLNPQHERASLSTTTGQAAHHPASQLIMLQNDNKVTGQTTTIINRFFNIALHCPLVVAF